MGKWAAVLLHGALFEKCQESDLERYWWKDGGRDGDMHNVLVELDHRLSAAARP